MICRWWQSSAGVHASAQCGSGTVQHLRALAKSILRGGNYRLLSPVTGLWKGLHSHLWRQVKKLENVTHFVMQYGLLSNVQIILSFKGTFFFHTLERQSYKEGEVQTEVFHSLLHFPFGYNGQGLASACPGLGQAWSRSLGHLLQLPNELGRKWNR